MTKKAVKITSIVIASIVLILAASPLWLGSVSKIVAESVVPDITGTDFDIDALSVNLYSGQVSAEGIVLKNPKGFKDADAVRVGKVDVKISMPSIKTNVIVVESVLVKDLFVSYVSSNGTNNFDYISSYASKSESSEQDEETQASEAHDEGKKVVIDLVKLEGAKVKLGVVPPLPIPNLEFKDIGKESNGVILSEVLVTILDALIKSCGAVSDGVILLGEGLSNISIDTIKNAASISESALKESKDAVKGVQNAVKDTGKLLKGIFK